MRISTDTGSVQSAAKALVLLKLVGQHHTEGLRLTDIIELTGFDKSTAHRLLGCLMDQGFIERVAPAKMYRLGVESMQLGFSSGDMAPLVDRFRPTMLRIARITGDTVFLVVRSRDHAVYVYRQEGPYPVKAFVVEAGSRRMLGVSAVGVSMLAQDSEEKIAAVYARNVTAYSRIGMTLGALRGLVKNARKNGFSEMTDYGPAETAGVGCSFLTSATTRIGISIAAISSRMGPERRRELGQMLIAEVEPLSWGHRMDPPSVPSATGTPRKAGQARRAVREGT